ncbi:MAG: hypothetical protein PHT19_05840 [Methylococcus sp.]|nr:hypothetical protein [Methylococcus sp.]
MNRETGYFLPKSIREIDRRHAQPNPAQYGPLPLESGSSLPPLRPASGLKFSSGLLTGVMLATGAVLLSDLMGIRVRLAAPNPAVSTAAAAASPPQAPAEVIDRYEQLKRQVAEADRRVLDADQRAVELDKALAEQTLKAQLAQKTLDQLLEGMQKNAEDRTAGGTTSNLREQAHKLSPAIMAWLAAGGENLTLCKKVSER